jgi:hypothetical protein
MTTTKLVAIGLGLAALGVGALLVAAHPAEGGTLLAVGGKLLGLVWPELGAKK